MSTVLLRLPLLLLFWALSGVLGLAQFSFGNRQSPVTLSTYWSDSGVKPGAPITLAVVADIRKPYHINSNAAKEPYISTTLDLEGLPSEIRTSTPVFPEPHELQIGSEKLQVFSDRVTIYVPMSALSSIKPGEHRLRAKLRYQACDDKVCLPPADVSAELTLPVADARTEVRKLNPEIFAPLKELQDNLSIPFFGWDFRIHPSKIWTLLLVAVIGGFFLNFTPCVLPLIPIKIIGLSQAAGNRRRCFILGASLSTGVVVFWLALAGAISSISGFDATNKLFQYPAFTIGVGVIICAMAVGMCGLFAVSLPQWIYRINPSQESIPGSFLFGIMTAVLSTPCTAPFMGAAAAWSTTQPPATTFATFAAIGSGMALPYLTLSAFPFLVNRMPRTGPASELIKQVMGLLMLGAGAYFLGTGLAGIVARPPDPPSQAYWWAVAAFVALAGAWLAWRSVQISQRPGKRLFFGGCGLALVLAGIMMGVRFTEKSPIRWVYYTPERLADAQKENKVIVLEFTAAWCLNCHLLEKKVLHDARIVKLLNAEGVAPIKVDLTGNNPHGNDKLVAVGRRSIPYLVVYSSNGKEIFASDAYTVAQLEQAMSAARGAL